MRFVGQFHIMRQLRFILLDLYKNPAASCNILLSGPSGYGKTTMATEICTFLAYPKEKDFEVYWANWTDYRFEKRVIFIDEIHKVPDLESLYGVMDSKKHVMVFATNQDGNLPEAFVNRCYRFDFTEYSDEELLVIARQSSNFSAPDESFMEVVNAGNRNPRIIKSLCSRLGSYFGQSPEINSQTADFRRILEEVFDIQDGLDTLCRRYLEVLENVGGNASILLLKSLLHVDENTLKFQIEPVLLRKNLIRISSKGRSLISHDNG
jgi:Holliday junction resolvasome RuvABC ATP-dependent DNA helicase subunit